MSKSARHWWESAADRKKEYSYQRLTDALKKEFEAHHKVLSETDEDAHIHVLWLRRLEGVQGYVEDHFPDTPKRKEMMGHIQSLRKLGSEIWS